MKYKRGTKVEVLSKSKASPYSWRPAEIIDGNGDNYTVRYGMYKGSTDEEIVENVSRKLIRPCPPSLELPENLVRGDVVEVFHNFSWKIGTVIMVLGRDYFLTRLLGSSQEFNVGKYEIRLSQSWKGDKWIAIGKNKINFQDCNDVSSKTLKRGPPDCCSQGATKKIRATEKESRASSNYKTTCSSESDTEREKLNGEDRCSHETSSESTDENSVASSVGSCSITCKNFSKLPCLLSEDVDEDTENCVSDAESFCRWENEAADCFPPSKEESESDTHKSELHAYRCILEAFYASGLLSWDQELLVTDLRISLRISNDEHLSELRTLASNCSSIPAR